MIFNYRTGVAGRKLEQLTGSLLRESSAYVMRPMPTVSRERIKLEGTRYTIDQGEDRYLMFAYLAEYSTKRYKTLPKFHTHECETRKTYSGYSFSPRMPVNVWSKDERKHLTDQALSMCRNCRGMVNRSLWRRGDLPWYEYVLQAANEQRPIMSNGYIDLWRQVSEAVREKSGWRCASCKEHLPHPAKSFYLEVHHKDKDKSNNAESNLVSLCVTCHANVDEWHQRNYATGLNRLKVEEYARLRLDRSW